MNTAYIIFPNQLFENIDPIRSCSSAFLVEEFLFFKQYKFHKQKILFHRASMKCYEQHLLKKKVNVHYVEANENTADVRILIKHIASKGFTAIKTYDPCDEWLRKRIVYECNSVGIHFSFIESPLFINSQKDLRKYLADKKKYFQTDFYIYQRKRLGLLLDKDKNPLNGKWSFDADNRLKYPAEKTPPSFSKTIVTTFHKEAMEYVTKNFNHNYGYISTEFFYPIDFKSANDALNNFFETRFHDFGIYEDAIVSSENHLHHSVLTPMLNVGLLLPEQVIDKSIDYAEKNNVPYNSLEGFVRQITGWREFIRMVYLCEGNKQRTNNYWNFTRKIPASFYSGTTGIEPVDCTIKKLNQSAYNHHIERLMVMSNFMLLCEFAPNQVYQWFMEMYVDAYDWVMVPNVYGMGQFADGGLICTKPYISGSNYLFKMSNYKKGEAWSEIWDSLFWRFIYTHRDFFLKNPRLGMLLKTFDKWNDTKKKTTLKIANDYLKRIEGNK